MKNQFEMYHVCSGLYLVIVFPVCLSAGTTVLTESCLRVKTVVLSLSVFLFIFEVVLAFLAALLFHINFRIILPSCKNM